MKPPAGLVPRRPARKKPVQLNLRRAEAPEEEVDLEQKSPFWRWVILVALFHALAIVIFVLLHQSSPTPPPDTFISLLPSGEVTKGKPGEQSAPRVGVVTPAPKPHAATPPPEVSTPSPLAPPVPASVTPPPSPHPERTVTEADKPVMIKAPVKPPTPKVKVDLTQLVDGPSTVTDKSVVKPKTHRKKPTPTITHEEVEAAESAPENAGLSREEIARKLGEKLDTAGVSHATAIGTNGAEHTKANPFADFYASLHDKVMNQWSSPNLTDETAVNPVVRIHVEKNGRIPPESVQLVTSSGNPLFDESALTAARSLGYTLQPLPDGCPPDIPITFKLTR